MVAQLAAVAPLLRLQLREARAGLVQALLDGQLDALITSYAVEIKAGAGVPSKLHDSTVAVIAPPGTRWRGARALAWAALLDERWILPDLGTTLRRWVDEGVRAVRAAGARALDRVVQPRSPTCAWWRPVRGLSAVPGYCPSPDCRAGGAAGAACAPGPGPVSLVYQEGR